MSKNLLNEIREARDAAAAELRESNKTLMQMRFDSAKAIVDPAKRMEALNEILAEMGDIQANSVEQLNKQRETKKGKKNV